MVNVAFQRTKVNAFKDKLVTYIKRPSHSTKTNANVGGHKAKLKTIYLGKQVDST